MGLYEPYHDFFPSLASVYFPFHVGLQEGAGKSEWCAGNAEGRKEVRVSQNDKETPEQRAWEVGGGEAKSVLASSRSSRRRRESGGEGEGARLWRHTLMCVSLSFFPPLHNLNTGTTTRERYARAVACQREKRGKGRKKKTGWKNTLKNQKNSL